MFADLVKKERNKIKNEVKIEEKIEIIKNMYKKDFSLDTISDLVNISIKEIKNILNLNEK